MTTKDPQGSPFKPGYNHTSHYIRTKLIVTTYDAEANQVGEFDANGLIAISIEPDMDLTQLETQAEILELTAEGIQELAASKKENQPA